MKPKCKAVSVSEMLVGHYLPDSWTFVYTHRLYLATFMDESRWLRTVIGRKEIGPMVDSDSVFLQDAFEPSQEVLDRQLYENGKESL